MTTPPSTDPTHRNGHGPGAGRQRRKAALLSIRDDRGEPHALRIRIVPWDEADDATHLGAVRARRPSLFYEAFISGLVFILWFGIGYGADIASWLRISQWLGVLIGIVLCTAIVVVLIVAWRY